MKTPLEFYGRNTKLKIRASRFKSELCPFSNKKCFKIRKSNPDQTIGSCIVSYKNKPLIICPNRFLERDIIFKDLTGFLKPGHEYRVVPEIKVPGGSIDYCLISLKRGKVLDFLGIEIQALDTTGSSGIWEAREDYFKGKLRTSYGYGVNWKMTAKTALIQLLHKTETFEELGKKIVVVMQDSLYDYISKEFDTSSVKKGLNSNTVIFRIYTCVESRRNFSLVFAENRSTNSKGVATLVKLKETQKIEERDIIHNIENKLNESRVLKI